MKGSRDPLYRGMEASIVSESFEGKFHFQRVFLYLLVVNSYDFGMLVTH